MELSSSHHLILVRTGAEMGYGRLVRVRSVKRDGEERIRYDGVQESWAPKEF